MGRIRTIKPEFWRHEDLSVHMLAAALLNYADDEGYFNANPGLIKAECLPLREPSVSIHECLNMLCKIGFIRIGRSEDAKVYGHVISFLEHQRINRPTASKIRGLNINWDGSHTTHAQLTEQSSPERKGKEGKGREDNNLSVGTDEREIFDLWNSRCETSGLPSARKLTPDRVRRLRARLSEHGLDEMREAVEHIHTSDFCLGRNGSGWKADFDFLCQPKSCSRAIEGSYNGHAKPSVMDLLDEEMRRDGKL